MSEVGYMAHRQEMLHTTGLDNEEKSECSQVMKLKIKLICFTFFLG